MKKSERCLQAEIARTDLRMLGVEERRSLVEVLFWFGCQISDKIAEVRFWRSTYAICCEWLGSGG